MMPVIQSQSAGEQAGVISTKHPPSDQRHVNVKKRRVYRLV